MGFLDDYEPVEDRIRAFWEDHPGGRIVTKLLSHEAGSYVVQASVWRTSDEDAIAPAATGLAHDSTNSLPANMKASALEVCETSAIGRALANLGYAPKGKRPSREEMSKRPPTPSGGAGVRPPMGGDTDPGTTSDPGRSEDVEGGASDGYGEGPTDSAPSTDQGTAELWNKLAALAGSDAKARLYLNRANKKAYTEKNSYLATREELTAALVSLGGAL